MLGILWKDLKALKAAIFILIGILAAVTVIAIFNLERLDHFSILFNGISTELPFSFTLMPWLALMLEQQEETNAWLMTLPCSRKQLVFEKYVLLLIFGLGTAVIIGILSMLLTGKGAFFILAMQSGMLGICFQCLLMPLNNKIGSQKTKLLYLLFYGLASGIAGYLSGSDSVWLTTSHLSVTIWIFSIVSLVLLPLSMRFAVRWMTEKEY